MVHLVAYVMHEMQMGNAKQQARVFVKGWAVAFMGCHA